MHGNRVQAVASQYLLRLNAFPCSLEALRLREIEYVSRPARASLLADVLQQLEDMRPVVRSLHMVSQCCSCLQRSTAKLLSCSEMRDERGEKLRRPRRSCR